jgi:hypothetical protein
MEQQGAPVVHKHWVKGLEETWKKLQEQLGSKDIGCTSSHEFPDKVCTTYSWICL